YDYHGPRALGPAGSSGGREALGFCGLPFAPPFQSGGSRLPEPRECRLWYRSPANDWLEALPLGNGTLGAMMWGGPDEERLDLNVDTLWSGRPRVARVEDTSAVLRQLRDAVINRRAYQEADALALRLQ